MTAEIIQFIPKANPKRELAENPITMADCILRLGHGFGDVLLDTAPSEWSPGKDSA